MFFSKFKNCFFIAVIVSVLPLLAPYYLGDQVADPIDEQKYPELAKFIQRYSCSDEVEARTFGYKASSSKVPYQRYFSKGEKIDRIINARRLSNYIEQSGLDRVDVAEKCWDKKNQSVISIARGISLAYVENGSIPKISLPELQQLVKIAEETGFRDWHTGNIYRDPDNNKLIFIDTEDLSFTGGGYSLRRFSKMQRVKVLLELEFAMDPEAKQWLKNRISWLEENDCNEQESSFWHNSKYDDSNINFEQVKREFYAPQKR